jgi:group I intron endonuclease
MLAVYKIINKVNGKLYIGASKVLKDRWYHHKYRLKNQFHHAPELQKDWNNFGEENFDFDVIAERFDEDELDFWERMYILKYSPEYNSVGPFEACFPRYQSREVIEKMSEAKSEYFQLYNPDGVLVTGKNLQKFSLENNLNTGHMASLSNFEIRNHKGWVATYEDHLILKDWGSLKSYVDSKGISYKVENTKNQETFIVKNKNLFAKEHKLHQGHFCAMLRGELKKHKGFRLIEIIEPGNFIENNLKLANERRVAKQEKITLRSKAKQKSA